MRWRKTTLIGVGLLGGSLGLALRGLSLAKTPNPSRGRLADKVVGYVRRPQSVQECLDCEVVDEATLNLKQAVEEADLVVFCTPVAQMAAIAREIAPFLAPDALVTDVGSVKGPLVREMEAALGGNAAQFVGSHPMAGSERAGPGASCGKLFDGRVCAVTPGNGSDPEKIRKASELWRSVGASVLEIDPDAHDALVARSSHMPHLLAAHLTDRVLGSGLLKDQAALCAGGFESATRVASGSPEMWRDIVISNRAHMVGEVRAFALALERFALLLERGDGEGVLAFYQNAKQLHDQWLSQAANLGGAAKSSK